MAVVISYVCGGNYRTAMAARQWPPEAGEEEEGGRRFSLKIKDCNELKRGDTVTKSVRGQGPSIYVLYKLPHRFKYIQGVH